MWSRAGFLALALVACASAITIDQFYPYGVEDQKLPRGKEVASLEIPLRVPVLFYGETYESIFVNNHGVLSFRSDIPSFLNAEFPLPYPSIAAFYTNIDTTETGDIFFRETNEPHILAKAEESVQNNFHEYYNFLPTSVFIATWINVTYTGNQYASNSFQVAVISNGTETFVELLYPERLIQWIQKDQAPNTLPDAKAQAGFVAEDGRYAVLRGSGSGQIRNVVVWSNVHEPGKYVYRVGNVPQDGNVADPDLYNQNEVEVEEESKTCSLSGPRVCNENARCVDYQAGICCECNEGFYGNGKSCIKDDMPLRVHGKLSGNVNNVPLGDVDLQAYVVVADGRSYTALSQVPPTIGGSLQFLSPLGGIIGWLFAKPLNNAKNGYQITGGRFNHTADIFFPASGERATINQEYQGHDVFDQIVLTSDVRGSVPAVLNGAQLDVVEYIEQFTIVERGLLRSESSRTIANKITGEQYEQRVTQTITFSSCKYAPPSEEDAVSLSLRVAKNILRYETRENIVRYGMSNSITPLGQEDPCIQGRSSCESHSTCVPQGSSFTCICQPGYTKSYDGSCVDVDECSIGTNNCDSNAECYNYDGGFQCQCRPGYEGNGISCNIISGCSTKRCDPNAQCIENLGQPQCYCNPGYSGNGESCWPDQPDQEGTGCDVQNNCSPYADCVYSQSGYVCQCLAGYSGNGYDCRENYESTTTADSGEASYNESFYLPICVEQGCYCPKGYSMIRDERGNDLCRIDDYEVVPSPLSTERAETSTQSDRIIKCTDDRECPVNGFCYAAPESEGQCICREGYESDGYGDCIEKQSCTCGPKAHCAVHPVNYNLVCVCDAGYRGDGYYCSPTSKCANDSDCEKNAECRSDSESGDYVCQCVAGYRADENDACVLAGSSCNGAVCAEHASCIYDSNDDVYYCECDPGYEGNAILQCSPQTDNCRYNNNCDINASCQPSNDTYVCVCNEGWVGDGSTCTPYSDCLVDPYLCDPRASCLKRQGEFVCECNVGYVGNGSYCDVDQRKTGNFLLASDGAVLYRVPYQLTGREFATPLANAVDQIAVGVAADCAGGRLYWGDVGRNSIKRAAYDGSDGELFLTRGITSPEGLSIDWSARNIFWTDSRKLTIEVANIDTKTRKTLFAVDGISNPRGIAVHPHRGKIFWSDWNRRNPKVEWANMDGTERAVFLDKFNVKLPNSLAIDFNKDRLCFADAGLSAIKCVNIDTMEKETIVENLSYPFGLAINGDIFYWTDWKTQRIEYFDISSGARGNLQSVIVANRLYGIAVVPHQCPAYTNVCEYRNGGCRPGELCLLAGSSQRRVCVPGDDTYPEY